MADLQSFWDQIDLGALSQINSMSEGYLDMLKSVKTEWELKDYFIRRLLKFRFVELSKLLRPAKGTGFFIDIDEECFAAGVLGRDDIEKRGLSIIACPVDTGSVEMLSRSPGAIPESGLSTMKFKPKYELDWNEWIHANVSLHGLSKFSDGSRRVFSFGESNRDPNYFILKDSDKPTSKTKKPDQFYHLVVGTTREVSSKGEKDDYSAAFIEAIGLGEKELKAARLSVVPSSKPVEIGSDRSMIQGFGGRDLLPAYAALRTLTDLSMPEDTVVVIFYTQRGHSGKKNHATEIVEKTVQSILSKVKGDEKVELVDDILEVSRMMNVASLKLKPKKSSSSESSTPAAKPIPFGKGPVIGTEESSSRAGRSNKLLTIISDKLDKARIPYSGPVKGYDFDSEGTPGKVLSKKINEILHIYSPSINSDHIEATVSKVDIWALYRALLCYSTY